MLQGNSSHLFLFQADPPTTTSQRLKALTTGGLPAFIEAGRNFDSDQVTWPNVVHCALQKRPPSLSVRRIRYIRCCSGLRRQSGKAKHFVIAEHLS